MSGLSRSEHDAERALAAFLQARDDASARQALARLIDTHAAPIIKDVVRRKLGVHQDAEDVCQDAVASLVEKLWAIKNGAGGEPIENFPAYVARIAYNAFNAYLRHKHRQRHRLRNQTLYVLEGRAKAQGFALWDSKEAGELLCGFAAWRGRSPKPSARYEEWRTNPHRFAASLPAGDDPQRMSLPDLLARVFNYVGGPMELDDLINGLVELRGVKEEAGTTDEESEETQEALEQIPDGTDVAQEAIERLDCPQTVVQIWKEIALLRVNQRRVLLWNLEQEDLIVFVEAGICSLQEIAKVLEMERDDFADVFARLPLSDREIAERLGSTVSFVRKLRSEVVKRLRQQWLDVRENG